MEHQMTRIPLACAAGLIALAAAAGAAPSQAAGCLKGAVVGGVAGHLAGHHAMLGAAAGCAIGHHEAAKAANAQRNQAQHDPNSPDQSRQQ
jgi:hypothetical protein